MRSVDLAIERHYADLRRYARTLARDGGDPDELVQDCAMRALTSPDRWTEVRDPRAYLLSILHNAHVDGLVAQRRRQPHVSLDETVIAPVEINAPMAALEVRDLVRGLEALPREQRATLLCVGLEGMSYREASVQLGVPLGTVMSRVSRARIALRRMLDTGVDRP